MIRLRTLMGKIIFTLMLCVSCVTGLAFADDTHLNKAEIKALYSKVQSCWSLPAELSKDKSLSVMVKVNLDKAGKVIGNVITKATGGNAKTQAKMAGSAKRAVIKCQPYNLPVEKHKAWSEIEFHFSTKDM